MSSKEETVDDFIGQRFGEYGQVEVIGISKIVRRKKTYRVKCSDCAKDTELFGDGLFESMKSVLVGGGLPCGCSPVPKWTSDQYIVKINRQCKEKGHTFLGVITEGKIKAVSRLLLRCNKDGHTWNSSVTNYLNNGCSCPKCAQSAETRRHPDERMSQKFMNSGAFPFGTMFKRNSPAGPVWEVTCPICSNDEYVEAGLCTGLFISNTSSLSAGSKPCRCSKGYHWTKDQREYQILKRIDEEGLSIDFVGWVSDSYRASDKARFYCHDHGDFSVTVGNFVNNKQSCPLCATSGFRTDQPSFVYILNVQGVTKAFTGFGITGDIKTRLATHRRNLSRSGLFITDSQIFPVAGVAAFLVEQGIKSAFPKFPQNIEGFRTEATYAYLYEDVVDHVKGGITQAQKCC